MSTKKCSVTRVQQRWRSGGIVSSQCRCVRLESYCEHSNWTEKSRITKNRDENHFQFNCESQQGFAAGNRGSFGRLSWLWATAEGYFPILGQHTAVLLALLRVDVFCSLKENTRCAHTVFSSQISKLCRTRASKSSLQKAKKKYSSV